MVDGSVEQQTAWVAALEADLQDQDLWQQRRLLVERIQRAETWLARHPEAGAVAYWRLEQLMVRYAMVEDKLALLSHNPRAEICLLLPPDFGGAVSQEWACDEQGRIVAWFTRDEFAEALLINGTLAEMALEYYAVAA